jgi:Ca-activated chloride channel family protein
VDFQFQQPDSLIWLWAVAAAVGLLVLTSVRHRRAMSRLATSNLVVRFERAIGPTRRTARAIMLVGALLLLVIGLLDPRLGIRFERVAQRNIDVIFALDTSRSMLAEDLRPTRVARASQYIEDVVDQAVGDRFGLVVYGGTPTLKVPLTRDQHAIKLALDEIVPRTGRRGGSMIGDAIRLSEDALSIGDAGFKTIIILSDGDDMGSYPVEAAAAAAEAGISIWTIGIGDEIDGSRIPIDVEGERIYLTHDGQEVWSVMKPDMLKEIAAAASGQFIPAGTSNLDLADIYNQIIAPVTGKRVESARVERAIPRYRWFIGGALLLLAIESMLGLRGAKNRAARSTPRSNTPPIHGVRRSAA